LVSNPCSHVVILSDSTAWANPQLLDQYYNIFPNLVFFGINFQKSPNFIPTGLQSVFRSYEFNYFHEYNQFLHSTALDEIITNLKFDECWNVKCEPPAYCAVKPGIGPMCANMCDHNTCPGGQCSLHKKTSKMECSCYNGFQGYYCNHDINECARQDDICKSGGTCVNMFGYFECLCPDGFGGLD